MNHYHDHERQTRRVGKDRPETVADLVVKVHKQICERSLLMFQLMEHPDVTEEQVLHLMRRTKACRLHELWESLSKVMLIVGIELHPYHVLPKHTTPVRRFIDPSLQYRWRRLTTAYYKKKVSALRAQQPDSPLLQNKITTNN